MRTLRHTDRQVGSDTAGHGTLDDGLGGVGEVRKLHEVVQTVVSREGRVEQHIGHIRGAKYVETASHVHLLQRSLQTGEEVHEGLAVGNALGLLFTVDEHEVTGPHPHVDGDTVQIAEVDVAHQVQRFVVIGVESEVLQQQVTAYDTHGVVVEAHPDAIGDTHQIGGIDIDLTVHVGVLGGALDGQFTFAVALQTDDLVCYESVG